MQWLIPFVPVGRRISGAGTPPVLADGLDIPFAGRIVSGKRTPVGYPVRAWRPTLPSIRRFWTFSEFCGEEPRWRLGNPQMFKDTHPHLLEIAGSKDAFGDHPLRVWSDSKAPRLHGPPLDENDRSKAPEIVRRFGCAVS